MSRRQLRFILQDDGLVSDIDGRPIDLGGFTLHMNFFHPRLRTGAAEVEFSGDPSHSKMLAIHRLLFDSGEVAEGPSGQMRGLP